MDNSERDQLLSRLDERTDMILKRLEKGDDCMNDLKIRVSKLEGFQNTILAFVAAISMAITIAGNWVLARITGGP